MELKAPDSDAGWLSGLGQLRTLSAGRKAWAGLAVLLIIGTWIALGQVSRGLIMREMVQDGTPLRYMVRQDVQNAPGIIIAHGFAGSQQLMLGYGYTFARAGYAVILLDFAGHATNPAPLDMGGQALQASLEAAYAVLVEQPEVDPARIGLAGHSMGSGAVMRAGIEHPERYAAVVALSPTGAEVTPELPRNLYLQAGSLEGRFVENAERLLEQAGGENPGLASGKGRRLEVIPGVEHITILFSPASHNQALAWLNETFGFTPLASYQDRRMLWYALHLAGWLILVTALTPLIKENLPAPIPLGISQKRLWIGIFIAPFLATAALWGLNQAIEVSTLGGMRVGGALALWYLFFGMTWLAIMGKFPRLVAAGLARGLAMFFFLWVAFGLMSQYTWLAWFLIPRRLVLVPVFTLLCIPWQLAFGIAQHQRGFWFRAALWLSSSVLMIAGFMLTTNLVPGMGVLFLYIPAIPVVLLVNSIAAAAFDHPWAVAVGNAGLFAWIMAVLFPLI